MVTPGPGSKRGEGLGPVGPAGGGARIPLLAAVQPPESLPARGRARLVPPRALLLAEDAPEPAPPPGGGEERLSGVTLPSRVCLPQPPPPGGGESHGSQPAISGPLPPPPPHPTSRSPAPPKGKGLRRGPGGPGAAPLPPPPPGDRGQRRPVPGGMLGQAGVKAGWGQGGGRGKGRAEAKVSETVGKQWRIPALDRREGTYLN